MQKKVSLYSVVWRSLGTHWVKNLACPSRTVLHVLIPVWREAGPKAGPVSLEPGPLEAGVQLPPEASSKLQETLQNRAEGAARLGMSGVVAPAPGVYQHSRLPGLSLGHMLQGHGVVAGSVVGISGKLWLLNE